MTCVTADGLDKKLWIILAFFCGDQSLIKNMVIEILEWWGRSIVHKEIIDREENFM